MKKARGVLGDFGGAKTRDWLYQVQLSFCFALACAFLSRTNLPHTTVSQPSAGRRRGSQPVPSVPFPGAAGPVLVPIPFQFELGCLQPSLRGGEGSVATGPGRAMNRYIPPSPSLHSHWVQAGGRHSRLLLAWVASGTKTSKHIPNPSQCLGPGATITGNLYAGKMVLCCPWLRKLGIDNS